MTIGTSMGGIYDDEHHYAASQWSPKDYDENVVDPDTTPDLGTRDSNIKQPPKGPKEPAGALKRASGTEVAPQEITNPEASQSLLPEGSFPDALHLDAAKDVGILKGFYEHVKNTFSLAHDVYGGKIDPMSDQGIERAADLAGLMVMGPATVAAKMADGTLGSFAGVTASKGWDVKALGRASIAEREGASPNEIWEKHGFFRGIDGRWRYEIPDEGMKLTGKEMVPGVEGKISDFVDHPELYKAYPKIKDMNFKVGTEEDTVEKNIGGYSPRTNTLMINPALIKSGEQGILDVAGHEFQHWVQREEGFSTGSNPDAAFQDANNAIRDRIRALGSFEHPDANKLLNLHLDMLENRKKFGEYLYMRKPGEVEANNVVARRLLPEELRKSLSPADTVNLLEGSKNSISGGEYLQPFLYPKGTQRVPVTDIANLKDLGPEEIKSAALKYKGEVQEGQNHGFALGHLMDKHGDISMKDIKDGFTTTHGRFISREEAFQLAAKRDQVDPKVMDMYKADEHGKYLSHDEAEPMLLSEDLSK